MHIVKGDGAEVKGWGRDGEAECYIGGADSLHPVASDNWHTWCKGRWSRSEGVGERCIGGADSLHPVASDNWHILMELIVYSSWCLESLLHTFSPWQTVHNNNYTLWRYITYIVMVNTWLRTDLIRLQTQWGCSTLVTMATQHTPDI